MEGKCATIFLSLIKDLFGRKDTMHKFLDAEKALEVVLYVSRRTNNLFNIVKTLYYADKFHLENYGRLITGDHYIAMEDGPVPSGAYDLIKFVRGDDFAYDSKIVKARPENALKVEIEKDGNKTYVYPLRDPNLEVLSESDKECLELSIEEYADMNTSKLWKFVHREKAYKSTKLDNLIPIRQIIALDVPNGKDVLKYLDA